MAVEMSEDQFKDFLGKLPPEKADSIRNLMPDRTPKTEPAWHMNNPTSFTSHAKPPPAAHTDAADDEYDKEVPFGRDLDAEHADWAEKQAKSQSEGAAERARIGQMKRQFHSTGGTPRQPKKVDPVVQAMRTAKKFKSLSAKARGRRR